MSALLSKPGKMPGSSFSLQAGKTCPSSHATIAEHGKNAICGGCYAKKGMYSFPAGVKARAERLNRILESLNADAGDTFVSDMIDEIVKATKKTKYFRIHDSGDFFSVEYVNLWYRICIAFPDVKFWAPTREYLSKNPEMLPALVRLASLPNVAVRPSAVAFGDTAPVIAGLSAGTAVATAETVPHGTTQCPATVHGNDKTCDGNACRTCWDDVVQVTYIKH